jgi:surface antigen
MFINGFPSFDEFDCITQELRPAGPTLASYTLSNQKPLGMIMTQTRNWIAGLVVAAMTAGCTTGPTKEQTGTVLGGVLGGVLGSQVGSGRGQTAATIIGAIAGGVLGGSLGRTMSENDRLKAAQALETTPTGQPAVWNNPDSGQRYTVTPTRTYEASDGPCRDYRVNGTIDGRAEEVHGTACRQSDGNWHVRG